eukprot:620967-Prorocentrum_lima.AAC.1
MTSSLVGSEMCIRDSMRCVQCSTFKNVWKVVSSSSKSVLGFFMVYVDDVIMDGPTSMVSKIFDAFKEPWKCQVTGIIPRDGITSEEELYTLVFLGMVVEV